MTVENLDEAPDNGEDPRLASLDARLNAAQKAEAKRTGDPDGSFGLTGKGAVQGQRVISVLVGYPVGGALIGWLIGRFVGGQPWPMLALMFLGFIAGCREVFRISRQRPE